MQTIKLLKENISANLAIAMGLIIVLANIGSNKLTSIFGIPIDCGVLFFPLTYLISDIANEKLGFEQAKTLVWYGFIASFSISIGIFIVKIMPEYYGWSNQEALDKFFALSFRISFASFTSYVVGMYLNVYVFAYLKKKFANSGAIVRFFLSTIVGAFMENTLFYLLAFTGLMGFTELIAMLLIQYIIKVVYNLLCSIVVVKLICK